jgi:hypothetical protein
MIQNIIAGIVILVLTSTSIAQAYTLKDQIPMRNDLGAYVQYATTLEASIPNMSDAKLLDLSQKISSALWKQSWDVWAFIGYVSMLVEMELDERGPIILEEITKVIPESKNLVTTAEEKSVEQEILSLQTNLESEVSELIEELVSMWNNSSRYEEKWDLKMALDMAIDDFMQFEGNIDISDYIAQAQVFDQTFSGDVSANYNTKIPGEYSEESDFSLDTNANIITKDGVVYLKLDNLSMQNEGNNEYFDIDITSFIEKLEDLANSNMYLEVPSDEAYVYLQSINPGEIKQEIGAQMEKALATPLLKAEYKTDTGYTLIPTKHFCDIGKEISWIFDPFGGEDCSEKQYMNMLEEFKESGLDISLTLANTNILNASFPQGNEDISIDLSWDKKGIKQIKWEYFNASSYYSGDKHASFDFIPNESLSVSASDDTFNTALTLFMDKNGTIYSWDYTLNIDEEFTLKSVYRNKYLSIIAEGGDDETSISCEFTGPLKKNYIDIKGGCDIQSTETEYEIPWVQEISISSELSYDGQNSKNDLHFALNVDAGSKNYLDFKLSNTGTRKQISEREIKAPEKTKDLTEFMTKIYDDIYSDYDYGFDDYDYDYEYESTEHEDHTEDCYIYASWDTTCYKYYDDKSETCIYTAETDTTECDTYEYGYKLIETEFDDYSQTCYQYDSGDTTCYKYYDDKNETCNYYAETNKLNCETYSYPNYDEYDFDEEYDEEDLFPEFSDL